MGSKTSPPSHGLKAHITCVFQCKRLFLSLIRRQNTRDILDRSCTYCPLGGNYSLQSAGLWRGMLEKTRHGPACKLMSVDAGRTHTHTRSHTYSLNYCHYAQTTLAPPVAPHQREEDLSELPPRSRAGTWFGVGLHPDSVQIGNFKVGKVQSY